MNLFPRFDIKAPDGEWMPIPGFEGFYDIQRDGTVRRARGGRGANAGRIMRWSWDKHGYPVVELSKHDQRFRRYVHRLVAATFIGSIEEGFEVNHKNGDIANPSVDELEIVTRQGNIDHAWEHGLTNNHGERCCFAKLTNDSVRQIRALHKRGNSIKSLAREFGVSETSIGRIIKRQTWKVLT